ncbi:MAG: hypothetical protein LBQ77_05000 [Treponema sp.]|jgi:hypothetical protein|nr:hypothetical protein [Treponema sp.]
MGTDLLDKERKTGTDLKGANNKHHAIFIVCKNGDRPHLTIVHPPWLKRLYVCDTTQRNVGNTGIIP